MPNFPSPTTPTAFVARAQQTSIFGMDAFEEAFAPYEGMGEATLTAYDLNQPGAIGEIKKGLGLALSRSMDESDVWSQDAQLAWARFEAMARAARTSSGYATSFLPGAPEPPYSTLRQSFPILAPNPVGLSVLRQWLKDFLGQPNVLPIFGTWEAKIDPQNRWLLLETQSCTVPQKIAPALPILNAAVSVVDAQKAEGAKIDYMAAIGNLLFAGGTPAALDGLESNAKAAWGVWVGVVGLANGNITPQQYVDEAAQACAKLGGTWDAAMKVCLQKPAPPPVVPSASVPSEAKIGTGGWLVLGALGIGLWFAFKGHKERAR